METSVGTEINGMLPETEEGAGSSLGIGHFYNAVY